MSKLEKRVILINTIFNLGYSLATLFMNIYLYIYTNSLVIMSIYTIIRIGMFPPFFSLGLKITKKLPYAITYSIGLTLITSSLIYALTGTSLFETNGMYVLFAALLDGIGEGFYWYSSNTCNIVVSTVESRPKFLSVSGICGNISSLLSPFIANFILSVIPDEMIAYRYILILIVVLYSIVIIISFTLNKKSDDSNTSSILKALSFKNDKMWNDHQLAVFFYGFRDSLTLTLTGILVYNAAGSGSIYSSLQSAFAVVSIISFRLLAKALSKKNLSRTFAIGLFFAISSVVVLALVENIYGAIYFGIANSLSGVFYANSYSYLSANIISRYKDEMSTRVVAREIVLSISRCIGMGIIVLFSIILPEQWYLKTAVILFSLTTPFVYKILIKYKNND